MLSLRCIGRLHSNKNPEEEDKVEEIARGIGLSFKVSVALPKLHIAVGSIHQVRAETLE